MKPTMPPAVEAAYQSAVVALLNACPGATEEQAETVVEAFSALVFTTMQAIVEEQNDSAVSH